MKYFFDMEGEDHTQFVYECDADSKNEALDICEDVYPEAKIIGVQSEQEYRETENLRFERLQRQMDYDEPSYDEGIWL
jgi:hypothetical protein